MKKTKKWIFILGIISVFVSCNEIDNYEMPDGGIKGTIYDEETNEPIPLPVPGSTGVMINLMEQNTSATKSIDIYAKQDGTYQHSQLFNGDYKVTVNGPFVGKCEGVTTVKGQTEFNLKAIPYVRISATALVTGTNKVSIQYKSVPTDESFVVSEVTALWNFAPGVDVGNANFAGKKVVSEAEGTIEFDLGNDKVFKDNLYKIQANQNRIYLRIAAKMNGMVNYSPTLTVTLQ